MSLTGCRQASWDGFWLGMKLADQSSTKGNVVGGAFTVKFLWVFVSLFLLSPFSPFIVNAWSTEVDDARLVDIFCQEIVLDKASVGNLLSDDDAWDRFTKKLEKRKFARRLIGTKVDIEEFQQCIESYYDEFETGEFILTGKNFLREYSRAYLDQGGSRDAVQTIMLEKEVNLPLVGSIVFRPGRPLNGPAHTLAVDTVEYRMQQYGGLWTGFVDGLKRRLDSYRNTLQIVKIIN